MNRRARFPFLLFVFCLGLIGCGSSGELENQDVPADLQQEPAPTAVILDEPTPTEVAELDPVAPEPVAIVDADFAIVPGESTARFELDETLKNSRTGWHTGSRVTVVGTTDQVFGSFSFSANDVSDSQFETLSIDANTFRTDDPYRNQALRRLILQSGTYPTISFMPTGLRGLPETAVVGEEVSFTLDGDLTIKDITQPQSFDVTATLVSPNRMEGSAATVVTRESYALKIIVAPHVTDVEEEVELYIDFVALAN